MINRTTEELEKGSVPQSDDFNVSPEPEIDDEFQKLIPPLSDDELANLKANLQADGVCLDPLVIWETKNILLGGHHRLQLCKELGIRWQTTAIALKDREAAKAWIIRNQLGRRNVSPKWKHYYLGKMYEAAKQPHGGKREAKGADAGLEQLKTVQALAKQHSVSPATISRSFKLARAIDYLAEGNDEMRASLLTDKRPESEIVEEAEAKRNPQPAEPETSVIDSESKTKSKKAGQASKAHDDGGDDGADKTPLDDEAEDNDGDNDDGDDESERSDEDADEHDDDSDEENDIDSIRLPRKPHALAQALIEELEDDELMIVEEILQQRRQTLKNSKKRSRENASAQN